MKICLLTHTLPRYDGDPSAPFIHELAQSLVLVGHKVTVLAPYDPKIIRTKQIYKLETYKYIFPDNLHILGYSHTLKGDRSMSFISYLISPFLYLFGFLALLKLVRKIKPDIITAHWILPNGFIAALVSKITKVPFTVSMPGSDLYMAGKNPFFRWMAGFAVNSASVVISDSLHYQHQLNDLGFFPNRPEVIRYGVDINKFKMKKNADSSSKLVILAVGRMVAKKGFEYLVKAMPSIVEVLPKASLIMVGDGEERKKLEKLSNTLKVSDNIKFVGMISYTKLRDFYSEASVFVMPSIKDENGNIDASPVAMMEAMSMGIPVIATDLAGDKDLIIDGITGYTVRPKNVKDITSSVLKILKVKDKNKIQIKVRDIAKSNFSSAVIARKYTKCFDDSILT